MNVKTYYESVEAKGEINKLLALSIWVRVEVL